MIDPIKIYRALLRLYPAGFREEYSAPLERQFRDEYSEASDLGGRFAAAVRIFGDLCVSMPAQRIREFRQDLRHGFRVHRRTPVTSLFAIAALALAIGVTTGVFSVVNALLIRSLPFRAPEQIVQLWFFPRGAGESPRNFHDWRGQSAYLQDASVYGIAEVNLGSESEAVRVKVAETSHNFFSMLGSEPAYGRGFTAGEDVPGRNGIAVISHALWQQMFGGDPNVLGATVRLNGAPFMVIGVVRANFDYPAKAAIWTPTVFDWERIPKTGVTFWETIGRLKDSLNLAQAIPLFEAEAAGMAPRSLPPDSLNRPRLTPIRDHLAGSMRQASMVLMIGVVFVLLIACGNIANLLLTRVISRRDELIIRSALGASRARLIQQLSTEGAVLAGLAALGGLVVAHWAARIAALAHPSVLAAQEYSVMDWRVLVFATGLVCQRFRNR